MVLNNSTYVEKTIKCNIKLELPKKTVEKFSLQVIFTDVKLSHRFIRFSLSKKYKDITNTDLEKIIHDYLKRDRCVELFILQSDNDVFKNHGLTSFKNETKSHYSEPVHTKSSFSVRIIYDMDKIQEILDLKNSLDNIKLIQTEAKEICR